MSKLNTLRLLAVLIVTALIAVACSSSAPSRARTRVQDADLVAESYKAADNLLASTPWLKEDQQPLLTASFVNVNSLENSSALGRIISEQVSSRFAQKGFTMIEMKLRNTIFIKEQSGEFALSRSVKALSQAHNAAAVVTGTYAIGRRAVYINARLIRAADSLVLAAYDYKLPLGPDTKALLASQ